MDAQPTDGATTPGRQQEQGVCTPVTDHLAQLHDLLRYYDADGAMTCIPVAANAEALRWAISELQHKAEAVDLVRSLLDTTMSVDQFVSRAVDFLRRQPCSTATGGQATSS